MVEDTKRVVLRDASLDEPERPEEEVPKLPVDLAEITDSQLMSLLSRFTRWGDYFSVLVALDEVQEKFAEDKVKKLEDLFMLANKPENPREGFVAVTKASMEGDPEIAACRQAYRTIYAHRKLMQTFFEATERDSFAVSRELSRRIGREPHERRADRHRP